MYPVEKLPEESDDGTMVENVRRLADAVVGHRIVKVKNATRDLGEWEAGDGLEITLDTGRTVFLADTSDCCAFTELQSFLTHPEMVDHIITGVGTTDGYETWHIYADMGDVLSLSVGWSSGNPFYYGYGFNIVVEDPHWMGIWRQPV